MQYQVKDREMATAEAPLPQATPSQATPSQATRSVFAVIPVHNRLAVTRQCLTCLSRQSYRNLRVIIVDDGSTDGTGEMIQAEFPDVILLRGDGNLWWTAATNKGIRYVLEQCTPEDYILVINDDVIIQPDYVATLVNVAEMHPRTLIQSVLVDANGEILSGGVLINWYTAKKIGLNQGRQLSSFPKGYYCATATVTGRGTLIPAKAFLEVGLYDAQHFIQCGDTEFPRRALKGGYSLIVDYDAVVRDAEAKTKNVGNSYQWSDWKWFFWDIRSHFNLKMRFWFAYCTRTSLWQATIFFLCDLVRITGYFLRGIFSK